MMGAKPMITIQVPTLDAAESWLLALGFRPSGLADWRNAEGDEAGIYPITDRWSAIRAFRVEINPAPKLPAVSRASHYS